MGVASPGAREGAMEASTSASMDAVDVAAGTHDRSLVLGWGAGLTGGVGEEKAIDEYWNRKKIKK